MTTSTLTRSTAKVSQRFVDVPYPQKHAAKVIPPGGRHAIDVRCVAMAPDGWLYAGTGLYLFRVRQSFRPDRPLAELMPEWQPEATVETVTAGGSPLMDIRDVRADAQGVLWACGGFGIASCPAAPEQRRARRSSPVRAARRATGAQGAGSARGGARSQRLPVFVEDRDPNTCAPGRAPFGDAEHFARGRHRLDRDQPLRSRKAR